MADEQVREAERAWRASGAFEDEQSWLRLRIRAGLATYVEAMPNGPIDQPWLALVVRAPTGVVYGHQCCGVSCCHHLVEGFHVLLDGLTLDLRPAELDAQAGGLHLGGVCYQLGRTADVERLAAAVGQVVCQRATLDLAESVRAPLVLDRSRLDQAVEAWLPVESPYGPGVLLYPNCD